MGPGPCTSWPPVPNCQASDIRNSCQLQVSQVQACSTHAAKHSLHGAAVHIAYCSIFTSAVSVEASARHSKSAVGSLVRGGWLQVLGQHGAFFWSQGLNVAQTNLKLTASQGSR